MGRLHAVQLNSSCVRKLQLGNEPVAGRRSCVPKLEFGNEASSQFTAQSSWLTARSSQTHTAACRASQPYDVEFLGAGLTGVDENRTYVEVANATAVLGMKGNWIVIKKILVGLGGTTFTGVAIRRATELAKLHDAQLTGVTVVDVKRLEDVGPVPIGGGAAAEGLREHRLLVTRERVEEATAEFESHCKAAGVKYCVDREEGNPFDLMTSLARYHDLMIFGLRSIFEYGVLGKSSHEASDVLTRLITEGVRPIIAVSEQFRPIRRVLIPYSGSMESAKTLKQFVQMRPWRDVTLRIVTFNSMAEEGGKLLQDAAEYCRAHGAEPEVLCVDGPAKTSLLSQAAQWQADLIVMGSSSRSLLLKRIFGETVLHVMQNATIPLFLSQ